MRLHSMAVALAAALVTSACQQAPQGGAAVAVEAEAPAVAQAAPSAGVSAADLSRRTIADLEEAADRALREGRIYTPAGDSAIEYWLEARARDPDGIAAHNAVAGLQPYLLIGCEEAIARREFAEARRLHGLIAAADPVAPALPRLAAAITEAEANDRAEALRSAAETARGQDEARSAAQARAEAASAQAPPAVVPESAAAASVPMPPVGTDALPGQARAEIRSDPGSADARQPGIARSTPPAADSAPESAPPRLLHQPAPRYPPLALGRRMEGAVEVAFTIRPDGQVEDTRVLKASPPGVFDRSALAAVGEYRFEPTGRSLPSTVIVRFTLDR